MSLFAQSITHYEHRLEVTYLLPSLMKTLAGDLFPGTHTKICIKKQRTINLVGVISLTTAFCYPYFLRIPTLIGSVFTLLCEVHCDLHTFFSLI